MHIIFRTYLCIFTYFIVMFNTYYSTLLFAKVICLPGFCNMSRGDYSLMLLPNTDPAWHVGFEKFIKHTCRIAIPASPPGVHPAVEFQDGDLRTKSSMVT